MAEFVPPEVVPHEAVAIAPPVIGQRIRAAQPSFGLLSPDTVCPALDGAVTCVGGEVARSFSEVAILLQAPHGTRLGYLCADPGEPRVWNLWVPPLVADSTAPTRITNDRYGQPWSASWFPDNRIAFIHVDTLVVLDLATGHSREFASPVNGQLLRAPAVSPDGTKIVFQVYRHSTWVMGVADGSVRCVLTDPSVEELAWSADGRRIAFHSRRDGRWGIYDYSGT